MDRTERARCPSLILSYSTSPQLLAANDLFLVTILPFLEFHKNGSLHTVMYPFVSGLFNLVSYIWNPFLVLGLLVIHPLNCWPISQCMSSPQFIHSFTRRWTVVYSLWLSWLKLLWTLPYKCFYGHTFSVLLDECRSEMAGSYGKYMFDLIRKALPVSHSGCTTWQWWTPVLPTAWYCKSFEV